MTDRTAIPLDPAEPRCAPSVPGQAAAICARARAVIGKSPLGDYSVQSDSMITVRGCSERCYGFVSVTGLKPKPEARPVKPWPVE